MIHIEKLPEKIQPMKYYVVCQCGTEFTCDSEDWSEYIVGHGEKDEVTICPSCHRTINKEPAWNGIGAKLFYYDERPRNKSPELNTKSKDMDCRDCIHWRACPCGKSGHENGSSIGYSIGECKDFQESLIHHCPFCGNDKPNFTEYFGRRTIKCEKCNACIAPTFMPHENEEKEIQWLVEHWNKRA